MKIRTARKANDSSSWASMSDIAFLLIIFFMITSTFMFREGINLILPDNEKSISMKSSELFIIKLRADSSIEVAKKRIDAGILAQKLKDFRTEVEKGAVIIRIEANTEYDNVMNIIDAVKTAGINKLSIKMIR